MGQLERIFTTVRINTRPCKLINFIIEERTLPLPMTVSVLCLELSLNIQPWWLALHLMYGKEMFSGRRPVCSWIRTAAPPDSPAPAGLLTRQRDTGKESSAVTNKTNSTESASSLRSLRNNSLLRKNHHPWDHFEKGFNNKNKTKHKSLLNSRGTLGLGLKGQPSVDRIAGPGSLHSGVARPRWALSSVGCCSWGVPDQPQPQICTISPARC